MTNESATRHIIVLNYADGEVTVFTPNPNDGHCNQEDEEIYDNEEKAVHLWCMENGVRFDDVYWMSWGGRINIETPSKGIVFLESSTLEKAY